MREFGVRIQVATDLNHKGCDNSTAKRSAAGVNNTGHRVEITLKTDVPRHSNCVREGLLFT